jgi:hypothetical protein
MQQISIASCVVALLTASAVCRAQELPEMPGPEKEHDWLQQLAGEWESESQMYMEPGKPPVKATGKETARMIGGFWLMAENQSTIMDMPFTGVLTLGYDAEMKKYVGTWIDSVTGYLWKYKGAVDDAGKTLTLETKGPCPRAPGKLSNFKEVIELKGKDHKVFTSSMQQDDGEWIKIVTVDYRRKK